LIALSLIFAAAALRMSEVLAQDARSGINNIDTVVIIYAENRSFDNLYGHFPGADGLQNVTSANSTQVDRDGSVLKELPPAWDGLTAKGVELP
jgi:phospholipase C